MARGSPPELLSTSDYIRVLRPLLPREVFLPQTQELGRAFVHFTVVGAACVGLRFTPTPWLWPLFSIVIGHGIACLAFIAHDLTHGSVLRSRRRCRVFELVLWGLNVTPPTMWRRLHNESHHAETNTEHDPDRLFFAREETRVRRIYTLLLFPHNETVGGAPLVMIHFLTYIARHLITALLPGRAKLAIATAKPRYARGDRRRIVFEILVIVLLQAVIFAVVGDGWRYLWASPIALLVTSAVVMTYIWTNHLLNPSSPHLDPLAASTTVIVPRWMNWCHGNFAYHTEHHVFPSMSPHFYPLISQLLQEHFPDRYNRLTLREAWRRIWQHSRFIDERSPEAVSPDR